MIFIFRVNIQQWKSQNSLITLSSLNLTSTLSPPIQQDDPFDSWWLTSVFTSKYVTYYYSIIVILVVFTVISRSLAFFQWCLTASTQMHNKMFINIVYSPMSFFNSNPSGRILNRFSRDIGTLDEVTKIRLL